MISSSSEEQHLPLNWNLEVMTVMMRILESRRSVPLEPSSLFWGTELSPKIVLSKVEEIGTSTCKNYDK
jgi:hypothetical protein